jgi:hypothetical protein
VPFLHTPIIIPHWNVLLVCLFTGAIIQLSQVYYFRALDSSDSGTVSAYWNLTPTFLPVISYWLFGYLITGNNYIGIALLLIASIGLCAIDKFESKWDTLYLMSIAASIQTGVVLLEKYVFDRSDFFGAFLSITAGIFITGLLSLGMRTVRVSLVKDLPKIKATLPIFIIIELINWAALYSGQLAIKVGIGECDRGKYSGVRIWDLVSACDVDSQGRSRSETETSSQMGNGWFNDDRRMVNWSRNRIMIFKTKPQYLLAVPNFSSLLWLSDACNYFPNTWVSVTNTRYNWS